MSAGLVLITGATGLIGFRTLLDLLQDGYRVRAAVRSGAENQVILNNKALKSLDVPFDLSFVVVPDIQAKGAYDEAVKDVDYVIHIASPVPHAQDDSPRTTEEYQALFIQPAVNGTIGILHAASKSTTIKRLVITSSLAALISFSDMNRNSADNEVITADSRIANNDGPYASKYQAYGASKVAALNAAENWMADNKPSFDIVFIHPTFVLGRNELALTPKAAGDSTNSMIMDIVLGIKAPYPVTGTTVHTDDVARLHVDALKSETPAGSYLAVSNDPPGTFNCSKWETVNDIVAKKFPEAIRKGLIPNDGYRATLLKHADARKTEKAFGIKFKDFESQVESVVGHYLELLQEVSLS